MNYTKLNEFPEHKNNPFIDETFDEINKHIKKKKVFVKGNKSIINHIVVLC